MGIWIFLLFASVALAKKCPGGSFRCPDTATCCELLDKSYGCCPLKDAICCSDHIHCCPANTKCSTGMCVQLTTNTSTEIHLLQNDDVICPDGNFTCPEDTTCCKNTNGYSCCPLEDAVCCNDGFHCCPSGTTCNLEEEKCDGDGYVAKLYASHKKSMKPYTSKSLRLRVSSKQVTSVVCPGSGFQCPNDNTCCKMPSGSWGCCPFLEGNCCKDGLHCCPKRMYCDATSQYCSQSFKNISSYHNIPTKKIVKERGICPDKRHCEDIETCCRISETQFGCCQYANATCCSDLQHCCPSGSECDVSGRRCIPKNNFVLGEFSL